MVEKIGYFNAIAKKKSSIELSAVQKRTIEGAQVEGWSTVLTKGLPPHWGIASNTLAANDRAPSSPAAKENVNALRLRKLQRDGSSRYFTVLAHAASGNDAGGVVALSPKPLLSTVKRQS